MNFVKNEYEAWNKASKNTKIYFMIIKEVEDKTEVDYCSCSEKEMNSFLLEKEKEENRKESYRVLKRKTICSFRTDLTDVNNMFKFFAWLKV